MTGGKIGQDTREYWRGIGIIIIGENIINVNNQDTTTGMRKKTFVIK